MKEAGVTFTGGCLCGAVRYVAEGRPLNVRACHCDKCRRATGGAFYARALFRQAQVAIEGRTASYPSSQRLDRVFCPRCGTTLFSRARDERQVIGVSLATLDDPGSAAPTEHIFVAEMLPWLKLDDGLPRRPGYAPQ